MALTLNNIFSSETGGLEEFLSTSGTVTSETTPLRNSPHCIKLTGTSNFQISNAAGGTSDAGDTRIIGFGVRFTNVAPSIDYEFCFAGNVSGNGQFRLVLEQTTGDLYVDNNQGFETGRVSAPFSVDTYYFIEIVWTKLDSGNCEVFINGTSVIDAAGDYNLGSITVDRYWFLSRVSSGDIFITDGYILSGATSASDRYGDWAVKAYQSTDVGDTDQGDTLAGGTWALVSETPGNETNEAHYENSGNLTGSTITDGGSRPGPSGDGDVTGATIKGAKYISNLKRTGGAGRDHKILYGNNVDGVTATADLGLTTSYVIHEVLTEDGSIVPTASEFFQQGFSKSGTGGQDIICGDQWAMLGYVPAGGGADTTIAVPQDSLSETDNDPVINTGAAVETPQDSQTQTDNDPNIWTGASVSVSQDSLSQTDNDPDIRTGVTVSVPADALTQTDNSPNIQIRASVIVGAILEQAISEGPISGSVALAPAIGTTISVPQDSLAQTDNDPEIRTGVSVPVPQDSLSQTDNDPDLNTGVNVAAPADALSETDNDPVLNTGVTVPVPADTLSETDNIPGVGTGTIVDAPQDALSQTDNVPDPFTGVSVTTPADVLTLVDNNPDLNTGVNVETPADVLTETDNVPSVGVGTQIDAPQDNLVQVDNDPVLNTGVNVETPQDVLTETDNAPALNTGVLILVPADSLSQTDNDPVISTSILVDVPADVLSIADQVPGINTGVRVVIPANDNLTLSTFAPVIVAAPGVVTKQKIRGFTRNVGRLMNP